MFKTVATLMRITAFAGVIALCGAAFSQDTTATIAIPAEPDTLTPEQESASAADDRATQTVVLLGERISVEQPTSAKGPFRDLVAMTTSTLGGRVIDLTTHGLTIAETAKTVKDALKEKPAIAVVFTGYSDEQAKTEDDAQRKTLAAVSVALKKAGARVFLVPGATTVGALTSANLRLVASDYDVTFIPIGTEVGGQPFQDAFNTIKIELAQAAQDKTKPASTMVGTINHGVIASPAKTSTTAEMREQYQTAEERMQAELARVAGQSSEAPTLTAMTTESLLQTTQPGAQGTTTTYPEGGRMTKRGKDAQENINMRPLPAVKAFRPQIPVPRNQVDEKEPALSR